MRTSRWMLMLLLASVLPFAGCSSKGGACDACDNVDDCESGLTCQIFNLSNGDIRNLCGDANPNMRCQVSN